MVGNPVSGSYTRRQIGDFRLKSGADQFLTLQAGLYAEEILQVNSIPVAPTGRRVVILSYLETCTFPSSLSYLWCTTSVIVIRYLLPASATHVSAHAIHKAKPSAISPASMVFRRKGCSRSSTTSQNLSPSELPPPSKSRAVFVIHNLLVSSKMI